MPKKIDWITEDFLQEHYVQKGLSSVEIGKIYNVTPSVIIRYLKKYNITARSRSSYKLKYIVNHFYFDQLTNKSAYLVGFITADGSISHRFKNTRILRFRLSGKDTQILEIIKNELSPTKPIRHEYKSKKIGRYPEKIYHEISLDINSIKICKDLEKYNIYPNKTGNEKFPNLIDGYKYDYLRGFFDGDGFISINSNYPRCATFGFTSGNDIFLEEIKYNLCHNYGSIFKEKSKKQCYVYRITKKSEIIHITNLMYQNSEIYLERKLNIINIFRKANNVEPCTIDFAED